MRLIHRTLESGHEIDSPREGVSREALKYCLDALRQALEVSTLPGVNAVHLEPTAWHLAASESEGALSFSLWWGELPHGDPHIKASVQVDGDAARLEVSMIGLVGNCPPDAMGEAGDLERCIAWAWLADGGGMNARDRKLLKRWQTDIANTPFLPDEDEGGF